jgi:hypothetical protein
MTVYIYILSDPRTGMCRYVGKSISPVFRFRSHCCRNGSTHRERWIKTLRASGLKPILEIVEEIPDSNDEDWQLSERFWISYLKFLGFPLTNLDTGGNGGKKQSRESVEKKRLAALGRRVSEETRLKLSRAHSGKVISQETRLKLSATLKGKGPSPEHMARLCALHKGRKNTPETIEKMRRSALNVMRKPLSNLHKQRIADGVRKTCSLRKQHKQNHA